MLTNRAIKGVVRNGVIEPAEGLGALEGTEVTINIPVERAEGEPRYVTFGMFANGGGRMSTEEDFREIKQLWEREWERSWNRLENE